jgi:lipoprotein NlpI
MTPEQILENIATAKISDAERKKREFYAELYIGLHLSVLKQDQQALGHLANAAANTWAQNAGYGPHYMWRVAKLHLEQLKAQLAKDQSRITDDSSFPTTACGCRF